VTDEKERPERAGGELEESGLPAQAEQIDLGGEETVGEMLLAAREKKGMALELVSQETKIPVSTLQYLETDNFEAIPAKVYATGFLKTYAGILGLDPAQVINKYEVQTGQDHKSRGDLWEIEEEVVEETLGSTHLLRRFVIPAVLVIVAIIILWRVFGGGEEGGVPDPGVPAAGESAGSGDADRPAGNGESAGRLEEAKVESDEEPEAGVAAGDGGRPGETVQEEPPRAVADEVSDADPPAPGEMTLRIQAEERIWFDLVVFTRTASGIDTLETDFILEPGESRTFTSNESFYIRKIGKTEGFTMELDGRPYDVPVVEGRLPRDITISRDR
jgi:cytoskeleton protein RodZ